MPGTLKANIRDTVKLLNRLDEQSLLIIYSGARLLEARQRMEEEKKTNGQLHEAQGCGFIKKKWLRYELQKRRQNRRFRKFEKEYQEGTMDLVILTFVAIVFAASLTLNFFTAVLCSKKINAVWKRVKRLETQLGKKEL